MFPVLALAWVCIALGGCASSGPSAGGTGGTSPTGTGGSSTTGAGGATNRNTGTGGSVPGTGGADATGGMLSTGGNTGAGGSSASDGVGGRSNSTGGSTAQGGATGGASAQVGTGGSRVGGSAAAGKGGSAGNGSGGTVAGTTGATGGSAGGDSFVLAWKDDFDTLDTSLWQAQSFTWDGNQAQFTPQNVSVADGKLKLALTSAPSGFAKPYLGVELRSTKTLTYGKVSASMRFASGSGVVSGLVLFYTPYPNCDWNEIDIEHLGNSSKTSQLNCQIYAGTPAPSCTTSVSPTQDPQVVNLNVDAEAAFHQYDIEWTPAGVKFFIDGTLLRTWNANMARLKLPQNILLTIWASNSASWAGALGASSVPTSAEVDWIKVYQLQ